MRRQSTSRNLYLGFAFLLSGAALLSGIAMGQRWLMLAGYLLTVSVWWARQGLPFTTRRVIWRQRWLAWRRRLPPTPPNPPAH